MPRNVMDLSGNFTLSGEWSPCPKQSIIDYFIFIAVLFEISVCWLVAVFVAGGIVTLLLMVHCRSTCRLDPVALTSDTNLVPSQSPLRQMYKEPFDIHVTKILQRNSSNPILRWIDNLLFV